MKKTGLMFVVFFLFAVHTVVFAEGSFTFAVFGDSRPVLFGLPQGKPFKDIISEIELVHPDFMVDVGDLVFGYMSDEKEVRRQYQDFVETIKFLTVPFYAVLGNHEIAGIKGESAYKDFVKKETYYSFTHKGSYFVVINTDIQPDESSSGDTGLMGKKQMEWLKEDLEKNKNAVHKFAFMHRPMFGNEKGENTSWSSKEELTAVESLFKKYKLDMVFAGHWHTYKKFIKEGIVYYITGGGGAEISGEPQEGDFLHYLMVKVKDSVVSVKVFQPNGIWADYETRDNGAKTVAQVTAIFRNFMSMKIGGLKLTMPSLKNGENYQASGCKIWEQKDNGDGTTAIRASLFLAGMVPYRICVVEVVKK